MKPVVGVMPLWDDDRNSIWMFPGYLEGIQQYGGIPVVFPLTGDAETIRQLVDAVDGLLFTGGHDVSPLIYGEAPDEKTVSCRKRDDMELLSLRFSMEQHKPVLGICRGIQFINAALGGTLYQDLPSQKVSSVKHNQPKPYDRASHKVLLNAGTPLYEALRSDCIEVNSLHHQAVRTVAPGLSVMATAEDGLVEAFFKPDEKFFWAVQWHPEFMLTDAVSKTIFKAFAESMR